ncbi:hypothetical protein GCM10010415_50660 [Streptomyces atrovirens]
MLWMREKGAREASRRPTSPLTRVDPPKGARDCVHMRLRRAGAINHNAPAADNDPQLPTP